MKGLLTILLLPLTLLAQSPRFVNAPGEYQHYIVDLNTGFIYAAGLGATGGGSNVGTPGLLVQGSFSASPFIIGASSCLHSGHCYDNNGNEYSTGLNDNYSMGLGTGVSGEAAWVQITRDSAGNVFGGTGPSGRIIGAFDFANNNGSGSLAWTSSGKLYGMGLLQGLRGNGTNVNVNSPYPVQITGFAAGDSVISAQAGPILLVLTRNGSTYRIYTAGFNSAWTGNGTSDGILHALTLSFTPKSIDIGNYWWFALGTNGNIYATGWYQNVWGGSLSFSPTTPTAINSYVGLAAGSVAQLSAGACIMYVIDNGGTLWSWGDNITSAIGSSQSGKTNWFTYALSTPFNWDQNIQGAENMITTAHKVDSCHTYIGVWAGKTYGLYVWAERSNHVLCDQGRNKNGVLANGVIGGDYVVGNIEATYPDSYDTLPMRAVYPFNDPGGALASSPYCDVNPGGSPCNQYAIPPATSSMIVGWTSISISGSSYSFSVSVTPPSGSTVANYRVTDITTACPTSTISSPYSPTTTISGLSTGTHQIQLIVTDSKARQTTATATITVGGVQSGKLPYNRNRRLKLK